MDLGQELWDNVNSCHQAVKYAQDWNKDEKGYLEN